MVIKLNKQGFKQVGNIRLQPGFNFNVDEKEWAKYEKHPVILAEMEEGILEVTKTESNDVSIAGMKPRQAVQEVKECVDVKVLEEWKKDVTNKTVLKAIDEQLEALNAEPELRERSKKDKDKEEK